MHQQTAGKLSAGKLSAQGSPLQNSSPLMSNAGDSGDFGSPISVSQTFGLRYPFLPASIGFLFSAFPRQDKLQLRMHFNSPAMLIVCVDFKLT